MKVQPFTVVHAREDGEQDVGKLGVGDMDIWLGRRLLPLL